MKNLSKAEFNAVNDVVNGETIESDKLEITFRDLESQLGTPQGGPAEPSATPLPTIDTFALDAPPDYIIPEISAAGAESATIIGSPHDRKNSDTMVPDVTTREATEAPINTDSAEAVADEILSHNLTLGNADLVKGTEEYSPTKGGKNEVSFDARGRMKVEGSGETGLVARLKNFLFKK